MRIQTVQGDITKQKNAEVFYYSSDKKNVERMLANHHNARTMLYMKNDDYVVCEIR